MRQAAQSAGRQGLRAQRLPGPNCVLLVLGQATVGRHWRKGLQLRVAHVAQGLQAPMHLQLQQGLVVGAYTVVGAIHPGRAQSACGAAGQRESLARGLLVAINRLHVAKGPARAKHQRCVRPYEIKRAVHAVGVPR